MPPEPGADFIAQWKYWIDAFAIQDIRKALAQNTLEIGLIILTLLGADCLAAYYVGARNGSANNFEKFLRRYFPAAYRPFTGMIYRSLRNGLIHRYIMDRIEVNGKMTTPFILTGTAGEAHLTPCFPDSPLPVFLNRIAFATDFLAAWDVYSADLDNDPKLRANVKRRAETGFIVVGPTDQFRGL